MKISFDTKEDFKDMKKIITFLQSLHDDGPTYVNTAKESPVIPQEINPPQQTVTPEPANLFDMFGTAPTSPPQEELPAQSGFIDIDSLGMDEMSPQSEKEEIEQEEEAPAFKKIQIIEY